MRDIHATNLAWALMEAAKPHMNAGECNYVFVTIGAGDAFTAIRSLINLIGAKRIPLHPHLVQLCAAWIRGYAFHDEHENLRGVVEDALRPNTLPVSPVTGCVRTPRPPRLLTVRNKLGTRISVPTRG